MAKKKTGRSPWDRRSIRALREHLRLSQGELAAQLGTRQQTVSEWETGRYRPRGASATLLSIVAERAEFEYVARKGRAEKDEKRKSELGNRKT